MAIAQNRLVAGLWTKLRSEVGVRFTRFVGVAGLSLATSEILLMVCDGVFHMTSVPAALIATLSGAVVSYVLSRWAWERKGKPDVLRETVPFWIISALVWVILTLATKLGYHIASWLHLVGIKHTILVGATYFVANCVTFLLRFLIFHYVLFTDRTTAARAAATGPELPQGDHNPAEAPSSASPGVVAEGGFGGAASVAYPQSVRAPKGSSVE